MTIEAALGGEMQRHLGYPKHGQHNNDISAINNNTRNGYYPKIVKGIHGEVTLDVPKNRNASFEPLIVKKAQSRLGLLMDKYSHYMPKA